jgi:hypothetical protein
MAIVSKLTQNLYGFILSLWLGMIGFMMFFVGGYDTHLFDISNSVVGR